MRESMKAIDEGFVDAWEFLLEVRCLAIPESFAYQSVHGREWRAVRSLKRGLACFQKVCLGRPYQEPYSSPGVFNEAPQRHNEVKVVRSLLIL